jgi:hypothetical protein
MRITPRVPFELLRSSVVSVLMSAMTKIQIRSEAPKTHHSRCRRVTSAARSVAGQGSNPQVIRGSATRSTRSVTTVPVEGGRGGGGT